VRIVGAAAGDAGGGDGDHAVAAGLVVFAGVDAVVAGRDHHGAAVGDGRVDRVLHFRAGRAAAAAGQAHVDHLGRVGVLRHAVYGATGGPHHRIGDVGHVAAAAAEHAHRQHLR